MTMYEIELTGVDIENLLTQYREEIRDYETILETMEDVGMEDDELYHRVIDKRSLTKHTMESIKKQYEKARYEDEER